MVEVPRAVADVDLGVAEIGNDESGAAGAERDALRRVREELHEPDRACAGLRIRIESALDVDDRGEERGVEVVVRRVRADDVLVLERVARPEVPVGLRLHDPRAHAGHDENGNG